MRPAPEEIAEAREFLWMLKNPVIESVKIDYHTLQAIRVLLAATEPPTDEEIDAFRRSYRYAITPRAVLDHFLGDRKRPHP